MIKHVGMFVIETIQINEVQKYFCITHLRLCPVGVPTLVYDGGSA